MNDHQYMKKDYLQFKYVLEIKYKAKEKVENSLLCHKIARYLDLEFGLKIEKKVESSKGMSICVNEQFVISYIHPDNFSIFEND